MLVGRLENGYNITVYEFCTDLTQSSDGFTDIITYVASHWKQNVAIEKYELRY